MTISASEFKGGVESVHKSVLLHEVVEGLGLKKSSILIDGTINAAGHSSAIAQSLEGDIRIIGFDLDSEALGRAKRNLQGKGAEVILINDSFRNIKRHAEELSVFGKVDGILLDLGLSSDQLHSSLRGFSFAKDEPLIMTFEVNPEEGKSAANLLNSASEEELERILREYGEEGRARRIVRAIVEKRREGHITSSKELADLIRNLFPKKGFERIHPATKTFQALRIATNDEIETLKQGLQDGFDTLREGGRMAVISFHSLEDREVKQFFKFKEAVGEGRIISKKPIIASKEELEENPRSRSAKLRIIEKGNSQSST